MRAKVAAAFEQHRQRLSKLLPEAECHHIGGTSVAGALTKGDLDIQVRVRAEELPRADAILAKHYDRNITSTLTPTFSSFKDDRADPPLGIQVTAIGGPEDHFVALRDYLVAHPEANERYNRLKRSFEGASMDEYRAAKSAYIASLLSGIRERSP